MDKKLKRRKVRYRIRKGISGTPAKPRLSVFKSNNHIYCQLIDDVNSVTLASASSKEVSGDGNKAEISKRVGALISERAKSAGINDVKFDRGGYLYHGRVKSLADGAREGGLNF